MWNLEAPDASESIKRYDRIVSARHYETRSRLANVRPIVCTRFTQFDAALRAGTLRTSIRRLQTCLSGQQRLDLHENYSATKSVNELKHALRSRLPVGRRHMCPYCGFTSVGSSWDHVLPKGRQWFPEFAVLDQNLIPSCDECNRLRGTRWHKTFLVQTDKLDSQPRCIDAELNFQNTETRIVYRFCWPAGISRSFQRQLRAHVEVLNLLQRWSSHGTEVLDSKAIEIKSYVAKCGDTRATLCKKFQVDADNRRRQYNENHWEAVLLTTVANSEAFFDRLGIPR